MPFDDDRDDRFDDEREPRSKPRFRCGGYASFTGHCGATDCETCYPGGSDDEEDEEDLVLCDQCGEETDSEDCTCDDEDPEDA